jgi:hypothetical protein
VNHRGNLKQSLGPTQDCLAPDRLAEQLTDRERAHVERCSRCQTELRLWHEFEQSEPLPAEGAAVQWIVAELARRNSPVARSAASPWRLGWFAPALRGWAVGLASIAMIATVGYLAWDREPAVRERANVTETYRNGQIQIVQPAGDLPIAPQALEWVAAPGAVSYDVEILEVDRTPLWRGTSSAPRIDLPSAIVRQLVPGKTILWEIRARNAANAVIAESGTERFRILLSDNSHKN